MSNPEGKKNDLLEDLAALVRDCGRDAAMGAQETLGVDFCTPQPHVVEAIRATLGVPDDGYLR